jgi:hypothetical protein
MAAAGWQKSADRNHDNAGANMKTSMQQTGNFRPTVRKIAIVLAAASLMGGMLIAPALARDGDDGRRGHADKGWHKGQERRGGDRDYYWQPAYRPVYREPYYYAQPVYVPPPVYYRAPQSPGVTLFFPLDLR